MKFLFAFHSNSGSYLIVAVLYELVKFETCYEIVYLFLGFMPRLSLEKTRAQGALHEIKIQL